MAWIAPESSSSRMLRMTSCWRLTRESPSKSGETCVQTTQYVLKPSKVPWQNTQTMETCVPFGSSSELVTCGIHFSPCGQRWFIYAVGDPQRRGLQRRRDLLLAPRHASRGRSNDGADARPQGTADQ